MQSSWQPDQNLASQLAQQMLLLVTDVQDQGRQKNHVENIERFNAHPDASNYYAYILACLDASDPSLLYIREIAGTQLRNMIKKHLDLPEQVRSQESLQYTRLCGFHALRDKNKKIREAAGSVLAVFGVNKIADQQILLKLLELSDDADEEIAETAMRSLSEFCDEGQLSLGEPANHQVLEGLLNEIFRRMDHKNSKIKNYAIKAVNQFILSRPDSLVSRLDLFMEKLAHFTQDQDSNVRKSVCEALVMILDVAVEKMAPRMNNVVEFIIKAMNDPDEDVALEACEFWAVFADREENIDALRPYLKFVVPVLLEKMIYTDEEIAILDGEDEDANKPDEDKDILFRGAKSRNASHQASVDPSQMGAAHPDEDDEYDDEYEDDLEEYGEQMWTIRKCAAAALDSFSSLFKDELMADSSIFLTPLSEKLGSSDWKHQEVGILALGAVAEGCRASMSMHLAALIPFLVQQLSDHTKRLVKIITCWTLGRYSWWLARPSIPRTDPSYQTMRESHHRDFLQPALAGMLKMMMESSKNVQKAGCSAFASLEGDAKLELVPYLTTILQTIAAAFDKYQRKNTLILYDAVGTLADAIRGHLGSPEHLELLMMPLRRKWETTKDEDPDIVYLIECLSAVSHAIGPAFGPYLQPIWHRCLNIIEHTILRFEADPSLDAEAEEKDSMVVALDLLSGVTQDVTTYTVQVINETSDRFFGMLYRALKDEKIEVRQSAYALLGDLAANTFDQLKPHVLSLMPYAIHELELLSDTNHSHQISVTNNATWAIGEIALKCGPELQQFIEPLLQRLVRLMNRNITRNPTREDIALVENAAITIGRLGISCPETPAQHIGLFLEKWCETISRLPDDWEKNSSFKGVCAMVMLNPEAVLGCFAHFCHAIATWRDETLPQDLSEIFRSLLNNYKQLFVSQNRQMPSIPAPVHEVLARRYGF